MRNYFEGGIVIPKESPKKEAALERSEELCQMYKDGVSICQMSKKTGINRAIIAWVLQEKGLREVQQQKDIDAKFEEDIKKYTPDIINWYKKGMSISKIKTELEKEKGFSTGRLTISKIIKNAGLKIKTAKNYNTKYTCDKNSFREYDKYSCYWAGLMAADGCVYKRKNYDSKYVILALKDEASVRNFKDYIGYTGKITYREQSFNKDSSKKFPVWETRCNSNEICENLKNNFNIVPQKTDTYTPPSTIPESLIRFFILGYIDGDGCISYTVTNTGRKQFILNVTGTHQTIEFIQKYFQKQQIKLFERNPERHVNNVMINLQGNDQLYEILSDLYSDAEINKICMQRKYERFLLLKEQQEKKYSLASA